MNGRDEEGEECVKNKNMCSVKLQTQETAAGGAGGKVPVVIKYVGSVHLAFIYSANRE